MSIPMFKILFYRLMVNFRVYGHIHIIYIMSMNQKMLNKVGANSSSFTVTPTALVATLMNN